MSVIGLGGVFYKVRDPAATKAWYAKHLGLVAEDHGAVLPWRGEGFSIWAPFAASTKYFGPSESPFMLNLIVDDLDAVLARLEAAGIPQEGTRQEEPYGSFAWILDPDGVKIELYQPR